MPGKEILKGPSPPQTGLHLWAHCTIISLFISAANRGISFQDFLPQGPCVPSSSDSALELIPGSSPTLCLALGFRMWRVGITGRDSGHILAGPAQDLLFGPSICKRSRRLCVRSGCPAPYHQHRLLYREATLCSTGVLMHYGMFTGAPGPPGVPIIVRYSSAIAIHWSSGDPGKGPITRYVIEARPSGTPCPNWAIFHSPHPALLRLYPWACFYPPSRKVCMCAIVSETGVWE